MTTIYRNAIAAILGMAMLAGSVAQADSGRGRHRQLYVTPAPGEVRIDGKLDDWDLSGQIEMFVIEATRSTMNAKIAAMYDDEAIYISGEVRDPTPMMNRHDPKTNADRAWDADAVQFRLVLDPEAAYPVQESSFQYRVPNPPEDTRDDIVHLLLWHFTDDGSANLQMHKGMSYRVPRPEWAPHGLVPRDKFDGAYRRWNDGGGYTFEYRIPWSTLGSGDGVAWGTHFRGAKGDFALGSGDGVAGTVQVNWSRPDGLKTGGGSAWSYDILGAPGFPFQSAACWGRLIFAKQGKVPSELVRAGLPPERKLPLEIEYELPADSVHTSIQLFDRDNHAVRILVAQQERPGGVNRERWDGLDDRGRVLPPGEYRWRGVRSDQPLKIQYRFSVHNSGNPPYPTDDNKGGWGGDHGTPTTVVPLADGMLLAWSGSEYGWGIIRTDLQGKKRWGASSDADCMACDGRTIYVSHHHGYPGEVRMLELENARTTRLAAVEAIAPPPGDTPQASRITGLACHGGKLYVAYSQRNLIGVFSTADAALLDTLEVPSPGSLAVRPDGALLVVSEGKIKEWSGATGPWQVCIDSHLDQSQSIAVGPDGTIYVANRGVLQNVSVFDAQGRYLRSLGRAGGRPAVGAYDPSGMYEAGGIGLDAQGRLWVAETTDFPKRISVWDARTGKHVNEFFGGSGYFAYGTIDPARPHEIYAHNVLWEIDWKAYTSQPKTTIWRKTAPNMIEPPGPHGYANVLRVITADNGRQYAWGGSTYKSILMWRDGDVFKPTAAFINLARSHSLFRGTGLPLLDDDPQTYPEGNYFWQDANDDQTVQPDELVALPKSAGRPSFVWLDKNLAVWLGNGRLLAPREVLESGRPLYDVGAAQDTFFSGASRGLQHGYMARDPLGNTYTFATAKGPSLVKWTPDGQMLWNYPDLINWHQSLDLPIGGPGRLWGMTGLMGIAGDYFAHITYFGPNHIFRLDGTYVGAVLQDGRIGGRGAYEGQPEGQGGTFVKLNLDGEQRYFIIHGGQDSRVWEVLGLDAMETLEGGVYVHTEEAAARAAAALAEWEAAKSGRPSLTVVRGRDALDRAVPVAKTLEGGRSFQVRMAYDNANLYLRYDVTAPHPLINATPDPQILFRGGNLIDLQLAADPAADPERKTPAAGDMRLLVTRQDGKPFAMLYRPKVSGFDGEPIVLRSPTGVESFDRIERVEIGLEYQKTDPGFTATVIVPLDLLGLKLESGRKLKLDLGYIFGNSQGTRTAVRAYLFNSSFSANVVDDIPNESRLEPAQWGEATVE
jgi:hypothetical protein